MINIDKLDIDKLDFEERKLDLIFIESLRGKKTLRDIIRILNLDDISEIELKDILDKQQIKYKTKALTKTRKKLKRKSKKPNSKQNYKGYKKAEQVPGMKLEIGKKYRLKYTDNGKKRETIYQGEIVKEYERYYLGITKAGYRFTIHKYPICYEIKEI